MKPLKQQAGPGCHCGSAQTFDRCCGRYHCGEASAASPEALMRSRYSAYVLGLQDYLLATWHPRTRPATVAIDPACRWLGLSVKGQAQSEPDTGTVEFVARYKLNGRAHRLHEVSRFVKEEGRWYYLDGVLNE